MAHPNLWGTTDTRNGLPTTTRESPDFSHGECQQAEGTSEKLIKEEVLEDEADSIGIGIWAVNNISEKELDV